MKLHSDLIISRDVWTAANRARRVHGQDIYVDDEMNCGSRKRNAAVSFRCFSEHGKRSTNPGTSRDRTTYKAATWTAWGYVIAELFALDPKAIIGTYDGVEDFAAKCQQAISYREKYGDTIAFLDIAVAA
jgi:hypothetical protein